MRARFGGFDCVWTGGKCLYPDTLRDKCVADKRAYEIAKEFGIDISDILNDSEKMAKIHYISGEISPAHHCELYPKLKKP